MDTYYEDDLYEDENRRTYQSARYDEWLKLRETEQKLFVAVVKAWHKNKTADGWKQPDELPDWVTRDQIATALGVARLVPYNLKLLDHLSDGGSLHQRSLNWIQKAKRPRWRQTYEGRKRPAGYEWVYLPREDVIKALKEMNPNNQKQKAVRSVPVRAVPQYEPSLRRRILKALGWS